MSEENNIRKEAVALTYKQNIENAPVVIAKGKGLIAENLIKKAHEHQIPIQEDPSLVSLLSQLDINESIPEELYQAVAEVFAFIYRVDKSHSLKKQ
jgi:flagellar biosynthesis protein